MSIVSSSFSGCCYLSFPSATQYVVQSSILKLVTHGNILEPGLKDYPDQGNTACEAGNNTAGFHPGTSHPVGLGHTSCCSLCHSLTWYNLARGLITYSYQTVMTLLLGKEGTTQKMRRAKRAKDKSQGSELQGALEVFGPNSNIVHRKTKDQRGAITWPKSHRVILSYFTHRELVFFHNNLCLS